MTTKVEILDKICGSGKTTSLLRWINSEHPDDKYIYVTPSLEESISRVFQTADRIDWYCPSDEEGTKGEDLVRLLQQGKSISCTHNLLLKMGKKAIKAMKDNNYILILDEELETIEAFTRYSMSDRRWLLEKGHIGIMEDGRVKWLSDEYLAENHSFGYFKHLCDNDLLYSTSKDSIDMMVVMVSLDAIQSARRVIISTYLFEGSVLDCYLRHKGIEITPFTDVVIDDSECLKKISSLIEWVGEKQIRNIKYSLSSSWYEVASKEQLKDISKVIFNIGRNEGIHRSKTLYTFPSSALKKINPHNYPTKDCWLGCTARATNLYRDRTLMIHAYNRYPHLVVSRFLSSKGFPIDADRYALAEIIQWVWRSAIRDGQKIKVCILSERMRKIFVEWLEGV